MAAPEVVHGRLEQAIQERRLSKPKIAVTASPVASTALSRAPPRRGSG